MTHTNNICLIIFNWNYWFSQSFLFIFLVIISTNIQPTFPYNAKSFLFPFLINIVISVSFLAFISIVLSRPLCPYRNYKASNIVFTILKEILQVNYEYLCHSYISILTYLTYKCVIGYQNKSWASRTFPFFISAEYS